jgi:DNA sulfur modification protein DndC
MQAMIDRGEEWMQPLLEFRDFLASTQDPAVKHHYREHKRRTGQVSVKDGKLIRGPYRLDFCQELLRRLLATQTQVQRDGPDPTISLITEPELHEIRRIWRTERQDWADSLPQIYAEMTGTTLDWLQDDMGAFTAQEYRVLQAVCQDYDLPTDMVARLLEQERQMQGMHRRAGIFQRIDEVLSEDWRDEATVRRDHHLPPLPQTEDTRP